MGERPNELQQLYNFINSAKKITELGDDKPNYIPQAILMGMRTVSPDLVDRSDVLKSPEILKVVDKLVIYQGRMNDYLDFEGSGREELKPIIDTASDLEEKAKMDLDKAIAEVSDSSRRESINILLQNNHDELVIVESQFRTSERSQSYKDADLYRNLVNGIDEMMVAGVILGAEAFPGIQETIASDTLNIETIQRKYRWLIEGTCDTNAERTLALLHNISMAIQIEDDWHDVNVDTLLRVPSMGIAALRENGNNEEKARKFLVQEREKYRQKARSLGGGRLSVGVGILATRTQKWLARFGMEQARQNRLKAIRDMMTRGVNKHLLTRERLYVTGELDFPKSLSATPLNTDLLE
ncbi:MAG: hypothetical protein ABIO02_03570 [Patescibacteria group bacterium]